MWAAGSPPWTRLPAWTRARGPYPRRFTPLLNRRDGAFTAPSGGSRRRPLGRDADREVAGPVRESHARPRRGRHRTRGTAARAGGQGVQKAAVVRGGTQSRAWRLCRSGMRRFESGSGGRRFLDGDQQRSQICPPGRCRATSEEDKLTSPGLQAARRGVRARLRPPASRLARVVGPSGRRCSGAGPNGEALGHSASPAPRSCQTSRCRRLGRQQQ